MDINNLLKLIDSLLCDLNPPDVTDNSALENPLFLKVYNTIMDIRMLSNLLHKGELNNFVYSKGFILSNLKGLQSNLRHLTWQAKKIADGDLSQKVDFMGDFSEAFNKMTDKLTENHKQLTKLANTDALTNIPNRLAMGLDLDELFRSHENLYIFMMDIDHFKKINDTYGHAAGDKVLEHVSAVLNKQLRSSDYVARYGGEEFVAALPDTDKNIAAKVAKRILQSIAEPFRVEGTDSVLSITISIGISRKQPGDISYADVIERSDKALYKVKKTGRNDFIFFEDI